MNVVPVAPGAFRIEHDGKSDIVYVAGSATNRWVFWNGMVFQIGDEAAAAARSAKATAANATVETFAAPMPARIVQVLVEPNARVKKGDTLVLLEAMKMELPIRATRDAEVIAVYGHPGDLVDADTPLVDLR